jgi:hypothetical protein
MSMVTQWIMLVIRGSNWGEPAELNASTIMHWRFEGQPLSTLNFASRPRNSFPQAAQVRPEAVYRNQVARILLQA